VTGASISARHLAIRVPAESGERNDQRMVHMRSLAQASLATSYPSISGTAALLSARDSQAVKASTVFQAL
jgi:hypothetical protein